MKARKLIDLIEQEPSWNKFGVKYARLEPTTDSLALKYGAKGKFDVQVYSDPEATKLYGRFMWDQSPPRKGQQNVMLNGYRWQLKWLPDLEDEYES